MRIFVDTSYFIAVLLPRDQWHVGASRYAISDMTAYTSSLVVNETVSLMQSRGYLSSALEFLQKSRESGDIQVVHADAMLQAEGWDLFHRWGGAGANAVDCVSFAIMKSFSIRKALTFDRHFRTAGFEILP